MNLRRIPFAVDLVVLLVLLATFMPSPAGEVDEALWSIYVMNADGSGVRRVVYVELLPQLSAVRWSHDGKRLAFAAEGKQPGRALLVDTDGRNLIDLGRATRPDWSPDDKQVLTEVPAIGRSAVWVQNASGNGNSWLASGTAPRWSPDGSQIALGHPLRVLDVITGNEGDVFTDDDQVTAALGWDWSPDGQQLAVVVERGGERELLLTPADGEAGPPRVRLRAALDGPPAFSPDGDKLAVTIVGSRPGARRIHVLDVAGDDPPVPIPGQAGDNRDPAWSPDGRRVAFASTRER